MTTALEVRHAKAELQAYALEVMQQHGLLRDGWSFKWNQRKQSFGLCNYTRKEIQLSAFMVNCGESIESMKGTVVHEVAHALTPGAKHGPVWQAKMVELGQDPKRAREAQGAKITYKWSLGCPSCDFKAGYHRRPSTKRRSSCPKCSGGRFNAEFELKLTQHR